MVTEMEEGAIAAQGTMGAMGPTTGVPTSVRGVSRDRWGDIYASMPVKRMIALYDYDPQELSPNVDAEVCNFYRHLYHKGIMANGSFSIISKLSSIFKLGQLYLFMVIWMKMAFSWVKLMVFEVWCLQTSYLKHQIKWEYKHLQLVV